MTIEQQKFSIEGPLLLTCKIFKDSRGFFTERFKESLFANHPNPPHFIQDNFSRSAPKVLRGMHFQFAPPQGKLVTCLSGQILDVAVDLRKNSPSYGQHIFTILKGDLPQWLWIPAGFAHGFLNIGETHCDVLYKVDAPYNSAGESAIAWNDLDLAIPWPIKDPLLSDKDAVAMSFKSYSAEPKF
jgi:dTDP-4-dehydrorhamnose 3,5-epimerase